MKFGVSLVLDSGVLRSDEFLVSRRWKEGGGRVGGSALSLSLQATFTSDFLT